MDPGVSLCMWECSSKWKARPTFDLKVGKVSFSRENLKPITRLKND